MAIALGMLFLLSRCARAVHQESKLSVETLTLSDRYGSLPTVAATLTGWLGVCECIETRQRLEGRTFVLSVVGIYDAPEGEACPTIVREYSRVVTLELAGLEADEYMVVAGDKRATFTLPASYEPETVEASIKTVDVVLREMFPVQVVAYVTYERGCDPTPFTAIAQWREGTTFFVTVLISTLPPGLPTCPPVEYPVTEVVTLETADLVPRTRKVSVNGRSGENLYTSLKDFTTMCMLCKLIFVNHVLARAT